MSLFYSESGAVYKYPDLLAYLLILLVPNFRPSHRKLPNNVLNYYIRPSVFVFVCVCVCFMSVGFMPEINLCYAMLYNIGDTDGLL